MTATTQSSVTHHTFVIERTYPVTPELLFQAFSDPAKKRRWFIESAGHDVEKFTMDFRVGGSENAQFRFKEGTPLPGAVFVNDSSYQDIVPGSRIVVASTMSFNGNRISASLVTFEFLPAAEGTELVFTHQAAFFEGSDGPEMRQHGWRVLFDRLATELARG